MPGKEISYKASLKYDKVMAGLISGSEIAVLQSKKDLALWLCYSIISQQLSVAAARTIRSRFDALFGGKPSMQDIAKAPIPRLRSAGLSGSKSNYVRNVAQFELKNGLQAGDFREMENEAAIQYLTQIKGVGRWTAEMFLIFALGRPDVFSAGDLGIQKAMISLYGIRHRQPRKLQNSMIKIAENWKPFRSYACLYLWAWKDRSEV